jgi:hypothetical protein
VPGLAYGATGGPARLASCSNVRASSVFDVLTFLALRLGFHAGVTLFRSGWFIESTVTELAVMLVLRTNRPFYRSRPGRALLASSIAIAAVTIALPHGPLARPLGLTGIPAWILAAHRADSVLRHRQRVGQAPLPARGCCGHTQRPPRPAAPDPDWPAPPAT